MPGSFIFRYAAHTLQSGGIIAYPTEGVFGLGCLPQDYAAVDAVLQLKRRHVDQGLILIVADASQLTGWANVDNDVLASGGDTPTTWIVDALESVPAWIRGKHPGIAVRLTTHPVARALCEAVDSPLVSTSANLSGQAPARNVHVLRRQFGTKVDFIVPGECGPAQRASEIRELRTGKIVRAA